MTCKDCIHYDMCGGFIPSDLDSDVFDYCREGRTDEIPDIEERCTSFKDKSLYIELPCKVGDVVYFIDETYDEEGVNRCVLDCAVEQLGIDSKSAWFQIKLPLGVKLSGYFRNNKLGSTVFLTKEEAERALKERSEGE